MSSDHIKIMLQRVRDTYTKGEKLMIFLDNCKIHQCLATRTMANFTLDNMVLVFGVAYTPIYNGIEFSWQIVKKKYRDEIKRIRVNNLPLDNLKVVRECVNELTEAQAKENARRGIRNIMELKLTQQHTLDGYENLSKCPNPNVWDPPTR